VGPTFFEAFDPYKELVFNETGRPVAAYTILEFFKMGLFSYEIET
jgi:hypothetical protein